MRPIELIPPRWRDPEPRGLCHAEAMAAIGALATVGGTIMSMSSAQQEAAFQEAMLRNQALAQQQKANEEAALGQRAAITEARKTRLLQSKAQARAAASGTDASSPDIVGIMEDIAQQGGYNQFSALWEGMTRSRASDYQAQIDLFRAERARRAGPMNAAAALFDGASRLADSRAFSKLLDQ